MEVEDERRGSQWPLYRRTGTAKMSDCADAATGRGSGPSYVTCTAASIVGAGHWRAARSQCPRAVGCGPGRRRRRTGRQCRQCRSRTMSQTRTTGGDEGRRIPWWKGAMPMASLGLVCRGRSVKGASGGGCWKGAGLRLEEECWVVLGLISSSTRLQALDPKGSEKQGSG
jgi:hypothetical protein